LYKTHRAEYRGKREEWIMRGITVGVTLAIVALVAVLSLSTQRIGAQQAETFDLEKAITGAKTAADHEAIAAYYDKESATAKGKAAEHRKLAQTYRTLAVPGRGSLHPMENHCQQLAQTYESVAADNAALAGAHRQMAQEAAQKKQ
jgi:hypothetical protein